jgi:hypothetical protein
MPTHMLAQNWYMLEDHIYYTYYSLFESPRNTQADIFRRIIKLGSITNQHEASQDPQSNHVPFGIRFLDIKIYQGLK